MRKGGMVNLSKISRAFLAALFATCSFLPTQGSDIRGLMPKPGDYTSMWWRDGFPGKVEGAEWIRCVRTGHYAFAMDTETLALPHLGPVPSGLSYPASNWLETDWEKIPPAKLGLVAMANGKAYRCTKGGRWSRFGGPRLVVSGRFEQRADITGLEFTAADGETLNAEARLETIVWPNRLGFQLSLRPGNEPIRPGEQSFGRFGGGYGFDGSNHLAVPHRPELDPEKFTLEMWAFIPKDSQAHPRTPPWLVCKNHHEQFEGNYGIILANGQPQARLNIGGGREGAFVAAAQGGPTLKLDAWNHLAMSYDGQTLRLFANARQVAEKAVGLPRKPGKFPLVFGRRLAKDNLYCFRGVLDEVRLYDRALTLQEIRSRNYRPGAKLPSLVPVAQWNFKEDGVGAMERPRKTWDAPSLEMEIELGGERVTGYPVEPTEPGGWMQTGLWIDPANPQANPSAPPIEVSATEAPSGKARPVAWEEAFGAFHINLDGISPVAPEGSASPGNDVLERIKFVLSNPSSGEVVAPLVFEKTQRGILHRTGAPITGVSAVLRDKEGNPTGIPIQLSKNWHNDPHGGTYSGQWFHGITQVRLPPQSTAELELVLAYGHWGGLPAVTHSQLSLIGWGGNQLWEQSAFGAWGESICFDSEQAQADTTITDVRPLMVKSVGREEKWGWTVNVGGGDFFRLFDQSGNRIPHTAMKTTFQRQGPCLTEVTHSGKLGKGIRHWSTVYLARSDDLTRGTYRFRMEVTEPTAFSRFVLFQVGSDTYNSTAERKFAVGDESGLLREWKAQWGGNTYRGEPEEWKGRIPWASLHDAVRPPNQDQGAWANRGLVLRDWQARLEGKPARPYFAEHGLDRHSQKSSTFDLLPPPGLTRLKPGDFVEAVIEHLVIPQSAEDYYGPDPALREALSKHGNSWQMIHREARQHSIRADIQTGSFLHLHPGLFVQTDKGIAKFSLQGGTGFIPVTFTGLPTHDTPHPTFDGQPFDQSVHGNDFWQTDYDPQTQTWSRTYNFPSMPSVKVVELKAVP